VTFTTSYSFSAAHRLHSHELSEDSNWQVYGRCNNPFGHGHNYWLEVTVRGVPDAVTGLLIDRARLDRCVEEEILSRVRHVNLNEQVEEFRNLVPTTENVAYVFGDWIRRRWNSHFPEPHLQLERLRIYETKNNRLEMDANEVKQ
jgi:6-pyruvoyltetrahydropterin/6-carboxytetrahydropterin synthase